jgi:hypothetical protein
MLAKYTSSKLTSESGSLLAGGISVSLREGSSDVSRLVDVLVGNVYPTDFQYVAIMDCLGDSLIFKRF